MAEHDPFPGAPRYRALRRLGAGRSGVVWAAEDLEQGGEVALKSLRWHGGDGLLRLKAEFRALRGLAHRHLVRLHELVVMPDRAWITMERIHGRDVVAHVRAGPTLTGPGPLGPAEAQALRGLTRQLAEGLAALHAAGRLHRDLKPANILVGSGGRLVILDFGLSAAAADPRHSLVGTVGTMAPEQARGERVGPPADWFAAGCVLFEALTGRAPYPGTLVTALAAKEAGPPALPPGTPPDLARLVTALLHPDPSRRPGPAGVLASIGVSPMAPLPRATRDLPLRGRAGVLAALDAHAIDPAPAVVILDGPPGSGGGRVVAGWQATAGESACVLRTRCDPRERVPMPALDGLVDALARALRSVPTEVRQAVPHSPALVARFPVLQAVPDLAWAAGGRAGSRAPSQRWRGRARPCCTWTPRGGRTRTACGCSARCSRAPGAGAARSCSPAVPSRRQRRQR
jgi:eukaryotic-like serine/threonine-protein kinase